jgi:hypothetical protein
MVIRNRKADALDAENGMGRGSIGRENRRYVKIGRHSHSQSNRAKCFSLQENLRPVRVGKLQVASGYTRKKSPRSAVMQRRN